MYLKIYKISLLISALLIMFCPSIIRAGEQTIDDPNQVSNELLNELKEGYKFRMSALFYANINQPADSTQNPDNDFLELNDYSEILELRPDFKLSFKDFFFSIKPRAELSYEQFRTGTQKGKNDHELELFINEYLFQYKNNDKLFFSFGRQFLQWGPSFLISPSNPFFPDNGKSRPNQEGEGKEFVKILWIPDLTWAFSFLVNIGDGRTFDPDFENTYALKADYSSNNGYASLIFSHRQGDNHKERIGLFGGLTATDALIIYGEAGFEKGSDALYPVSDNNPLNYSMNSIEQDDHSINSTFLVGGTYTFESGSSMTFEYLYNQTGYNDQEASDYHNLRQNAHDSYNLPSSIAGLSRQTLGQTYDNGLMFLRQNYLMLQYIQSDVFDIFDITFRLTHCIDDKSSQLVSLVDIFAGDNTRFFASGIINTGGDESAFGSILDYQAMIGVEYTF